MEILPKQIYNYERLIKNDSVEALELKNKILEIIIENSMTPLLIELTAKFNWEVDEALIASMKEKNLAELEIITNKMNDAVKNAGDMEIMDCMFLKARTLSKFGNWNESDLALDEILNKPKISTGKKIDAMIDKAKNALLSMDTQKLKVCITEATKLVELGGDWDRRNRLKVYEAYYLLTIRDLRGAAKLFLDCIATFTTNDLCSYKQFMYYTILTNVFALDRIDLKKKILSIYDEIIQDRYFGPLAVFLIREYRVLAYAQFLEAYKSVMLSSMAESFGITPTLLDAELSRFIAAGRLNAKIDKVGDMIETRRPDKKNSQYQDVIKKGDLLLNQIQKLVRIIDV